MLEKKLPWLRNLIAFGGAITGIILTAIGGVMILNSVLKLYVFQLETNAYFSLDYEECKYDYRSEKRITRSEEEQKECETKRLENNKNQFQRRQKEGLIDGLGMLIVGIPFWLIFDRKRRFEG